MRYALFLILISGPAGAWAAPDLAGCRFADPPQVIPGIDATKNEMANMGATVRAYIQDMNDSLACLDEKEAALGAGITGEDKALIDAVYNRGIEQMQIIAKGYNDQLDLYEYRQRIPDAGQGVDVITRGDRAPSTRQSSTEEDD